MRTIMIAALAAVLIGCASMDERRNAAPEYRYTSQKEVDEIAECILYAWQNQSLAWVQYEAAIQPKPGDGRTVVTQGQVEFADIAPGMNGSDVAIFFQDGIMQWRKKRRSEAVQECL